MSKVYSQSELIQYVNVLKVTIPRMNKLLVPLTPENYSVWYEYSMGTSLELNERIDNYLNEGTCFTRELNESLYFEFVAKEHLVELKKVQESTKNLIYHLVQKIQQMSTGSTKFGEILDNCKQLLEGEPDIGKLTNIVNHVIEETEMIRRSNVKILNNLKSMKDEVITLKAGVESLTATAHTDPLTNIANRRAFEKQLRYFVGRV